MLNRIAESPQFVKPQAKLSTVLAGSEGDCCESPAPNGLTHLNMKRRNPSPRPNGHPSPTTGRGDMSYQHSPSP